MPRLLYMSSVNTGYHQNEADSLVAARYSYTRLLQLSLNWI
jgi:hypothetical protein